MGAEALPEGIITRFRSLSLERVGRVEGTWNSVIAGVRDPKAIRDLLRELHTLKGDSRIVGFDEIHLLAHKLEELFALAKMLDYRVSEDVELVITMSIQFLGMLLRRKQAGSTGGIDLPGFVRQVDEVLREARTMPIITTPRAQTQTKMEARDGSIARLSEATRHRLAIAATGAFLEYLGARGTTSRNRLRSVWAALRDELASLRAVSLADVLQRHLFAANRLAGDLKKRVGIEVDVGSVYVDTRVAEAVDIALVHLIRNAIDHGIESPEQRALAGKPEQGTIVIRAIDKDGLTTITVEDDGAGIDVAAIRARAVERGLLEPTRAARSTDAEMLAYVFQAGFSTRDQVGEVSGRGVGLDAVQSALVRAGGVVRVASSPGRGSTVTLEAPSAARQLRVYQFLALGGRLSFAVTARWDVQLETGVAGALDPAAVIQIPGTSRQTVDLTPQTADVALRLRWGFLDILLRAGSPPTLVTADRICPTPDDYPLEVVVIDGRETILLRPEYLATTNVAQLTTR
ncbi:MAG: ATP-binding protein [Kofleriaceae bacterium]